MNYRHLVSSLLLVTLFLLTSCGIYTAKSSTTAASLNVHAQPSPTVPAGYTPVYITFKQGKMSSSLTIFKKGTPYFFTIVNNDTSMHQFEITPPTYMGGHAILKGPTPLAQVGQIEPGVARTLTFTFHTTAAPHKLEFKDDSGNPCLATKRVAIVVIQS